MDIKEFENKLKESAENYKVSAMSLEEDQAVYEDLINTLLTGYEREYKEGSLPPLSEIEKSLATATNPIDLAAGLYNYLVAISALSAGGEPIKFSEVYTWKDDEVITKELLQKIEDKLRASLTKTDALSQGFMVLSKCLGIIQGNITYPKTTDSIPPHIGSTSNSSAGVYHDLGQLKTYYSNNYELCPSDEPYIFISNESTGIVEPRGVFSIYMLPTNSGTAADMSFSPKYYYTAYTGEEVQANLDSRYFTFDGLELFLEVLSKPVVPNTIFEKFVCNLTYSNETGIYSGSGEVLSSCYYTCSFDPKTFTCKISLSSYHPDFRAGEVFGVDIMPKNKSYIPSRYNGFISLGSNKKYFLWRSLYSSEPICENTYKVTE